MTKELWKNIVKQFIEVIKDTVSTVQALLITDRLCSHLNIHSLFLLLRNNVFALFLPSYTMYLLQPLHNLVFAKFKGVVSRHQDRINKVNKLHTQRINNVTKNITTKVEKQAFKKSIIKKSWTNAVLWPPNFERIHELVQEQCGVVDPKRISTEDERLVANVQQIFEQYAVSHSSSSQRKQDVIKKANSLYSSIGIITEVEKEEAEISVASLENTRKSSSRKKRKVCEM